MKKPEISRQIVRTPVVTQIGRFITASCAVVALGFALNSAAVNILTNPGFDSSPGFSGWSAHSTETWSYAVHNDVSISSPDSCWQQGLYGNGGAPNTYISYVYQRISAAPGSTYTADAWFTQFVFGSVDGGDNGSSGLYGDNMALYSTNYLNTGYYEDGWVEVQFLSSSNTILADYKSFIINPAYVHNLATAGATTTNVTATTTNAYLNWFDCSVTNQYNPNTIVVNGDPDPGNFTGAPISPGPTNSIPSGIMTAPPGTRYVQFSLNLCQTSYSSGAPHWDNCALNQLSGPSPSVIGNIAPNGGKLFNIASTNFTFNVQSFNGITVASNAIQVVQNGADVSKRLTFSGNNTNWNVTLPGLTSNNVYTMAITVNNSAGLVSTASARFDTFDPNSFIVSAEDYNFNNGQFIQNPIPNNAAGPNTYFGTLGVSGADYAVLSGGVAGGGNNLIPNYPNRNTNTAWQIASDPNLPLYLAQSNSAIYNVNISYNNAGNWYMYTRNPYPSGGYYQVYARMSDGGSATVGGSETLQLVTSGAGTPTFTTTNLGYFVLNGATLGWTPDWNTYYWVPLGQDASGLNPAVVSLPPGQQTLQLISGNGCNLIDFMFVPIPALGLPPYIKNFNPAILTPGQNVFVSGNTLTFTVSSLISTVATNNIQTYINGVSAPETFTGSSSNWTVSVSLNGVANQPNVAFSISAVDNNGLSNGVAGTFDTFSQNNMMIEAGDFDFNSGQWIDNPLETATTVALTNSYYGYPGNNLANAAVSGVDFSTTNTTTAETYLYRFDGNGPGGFAAAGTEVTSDFLRSKLINMGPTAVQPFEYVPGEAVPMTNTDFDVGWWPPGTWLNYTRTFPSNSYVVYGRLASDTPYSGATMALVTAGRGTPSQTTQTLGTFSDANASGFQSWHWVPLMTNGQLAVVTLSGVQTLKVTAPPGSATGSMNGHFYMFVPYSAINAFSINATVSGGVVSIKFPTQSTHNYTVQYSSSLNPASWQTLSSGIAGDGTVKTVTDSTSGGAVRFYRVVAQ
ncbi:MAG TPA: hypothetical protein VG077_16410 [Verrucomicrobiae bacterium]|nr:hypothetical protein [Verrucomicrobiae bacterium]